MARVEGSPPYQISDNPQEACGVTAVFGKHGQDTIPIAISYQDELRHRGRDASGVAGINKNNNEIVTYKGPGRALLAFNGIDFQSLELKGDRIITHGRYATSGAENKDGNEGMQPVVESYNGRSIAIAFNGNLPDQMRARLRSRIPEDMPTPPDIDTYDIAQAIISSPEDNWEDKFRSTFTDIPLAFSLTMLTDDNRIFGLRCPAGTWPLWIGEKGDQITFSSESRVVQDPEIRWTSVKPGELVEATVDGVRHTQLFEPIEKRCSLNDGYFARGDSLIFDQKYASEFSEGVRYEEFRQEVGRVLAREFPIEADMYIGVPETGLSYVKGYVNELGKDHTEFIKKNDEDKTFISPNKKETLSRIDRKFLIPNPELSLDILEGVTSAVVIDDSVVKGNTMGGDKDHGVDGIIQKLRKAGISKIHVLSGLPKFTKPCDQGVYIPQEDLVAVEKDSNGELIEVENEEIATKLGADSVNYLSVDGYKSVYEQFTGNRELACMSCLGEPHPLDEVQPKNNVYPITLYSGSAPKRTESAAD